MKVNKKRKYKSSCGREEERGEIPFLAKTFNSYIFLSQNNLKYFFLFLHFGFLLLSFVLITYFRCHNVIDVDCKKRSDSERASFDFHTKKVSAYSVGDDIIEKFTSFPC